MLTARLISQRGIPIVLSLLAAIALGAGIAFVPLRSIAGLIMIPVLMLIATAWVWLIIPPDERPWVLKIVLLALLARNLLSVGMEFAWPTFEGRSDGAAYGPHGQLIAQAWRSGQFVSYSDVVSTPTSAFGYVYLNALVYRVLGYNTLFIKLLNGLFTAMACAYTYLIGRRLLTLASAHFAAICLAFMPSIILWTSQNLKDSLVVLLSIWIMWEILEIAQHKHMHIVLLGGLLVFLATIRVETALGLALILVPNLFFQTRGNAGNRLLITVGGVLVVGWLLLQLGYGFLGADLVNSRLSLEAIISRQAGAAYGASAVATTAPSTLIGFVLYLPQAVANYLLRPWPWEVTSGLQLATLPESLFIWYPLFVLACWGIWKLLKHQSTQTMILWSYVIAATLAAAPNYGNLGTAYRHRIQLWPFYFLLAGYAFSSWRQRAAAAESGRTTALSPSS